MKFDISFIRDSIKLIIPDIIKIVSTILTSIFLAKLLGPKNLGIYSTAALVMMYGVLLHMGIKQATGLKIPLMIGKGLKKEVDLCLSFSLGGILSILLFFSPIFIIFTIFYIENEMLFFGMIATLCGLFLYEIYNLLEAKARLNYRITTVFYSQTMLIIFRSIFVILGAYFFDLYGAFIALVICYLPSLLYLLLIKNETISIKWSFLETKNLIKTGFPLFIAGMMMTIFISLDRWFILSSEGIERLGFYTFILGISSIISIIPQKIASFMSQYIREAVGANVSKKEMANVTGFLCLTILIILIPIVLMIYHFGIFLISSYLTEYLESIHLLDILIFSSFFLTGFHFYSQYLIGLGAKKHIIKAQTIGLLLAISFYFLAVYFDGSLFAISIANLLASLTLSLIMAIYVKKTGVSFSDINLISSISIILLSVLLLNLIDPSGIVDFVSIRQGIIELTKLFVIDLSILIFLLVLIWKLNMIEKVKGFLQRDFKFKES